MASVIWASALTSIAGRALISRKRDSALFMPTIGQSHRRLILLLLCTFALAACEAKVISPETVDMAGSIAPAYVDQALENLARFRNQPDSIPSQIDLADGMIVISPDATQLPPANQPETNPLRSTQASNQLGDSSEPAHTMIITARLAQRGEWSISPVTDPTRLHNLAALYRYAATGIDDKCDVGRLTREYHLPTIITADKIGVDPNYLTGATCVFCLTTHEAAELIRTRRIDAIQPAQVLRADHLNPSLQCNQAHKLWLHFSAGPGPAEGRDLGIHQGQYIWIDRAEPNNRLSDFVMFTLPAMKPTPNPGVYTKAAPEAAARNNRIK